MAPQELEKDSLAKKHQYYNSSLKTAIARNENLQPITNDGNDIGNLLKIDIACSRKDVDYIFNVLKCNDILYVSRAIKRNTWLITDEQYAPLMNVEYLSTQLFPHMMTKSINKLMLKIRLNLRDQKRVEEFYNYYKKEGNDATKWLQYCSLQFVEDVLRNLKINMPVHIFKRLCKKSITVLSVYLQNKNIYTCNILDATLFLLNTQPEIYLDILESVHYSKYPTFGVKYTNVVMKSFRARILSNFEKYVHCVHFPTFAKYLNKDEIRKIVTEDFKNRDIKYLLTYENIKHFIRRITKDGRFECLKKMLIDRDEIDECYDCVMYNSFTNMNWYSFKTYRLYEFAPFTEAFTELKKLIRIESSPAERNEIIYFLLNCAGLNSDNLQCVLQYYHDKHMNEPLKFKINFINYFLKKTKMNVDFRIWDTLNRLFHSIEVYTELDNNTQKCVHAIILHNAIVGEKSPDIIEKKFSFHTFKNYRIKLNTEEKENVFQYLYKYCLSKINEIEIINNMDFIEVADILTNILQLFVDWEKELQNYPLILYKIKELAKIKQHKEGYTSLAAIYNINKLWRKYMFEESFVLYPSEEVCINALKHDTDLIKRYKGQVVQICQTEKLTRYLNKLRIHWPDSITIECTNTYVESLKNISSHKYTISGLMTILPNEQLLSILKKYTPDDTKINWNEQDANVVSIRKHIAKSMHLSRPLISLDMVLIFAKGDYLQYTIPSLYSILYALSRIQSFVDIPRLLKSPVSLQKHGIRFAVTKIPNNKIKSMFLETWNSTKNPSVRSVLFIQTYHIMCKAGNSDVAEEMFSLLTLFIDNLSAEENKDIYNYLGKVRNVPKHLNGKFFMKSYTFLKSLPPKANCEPIVRRLIDYAPEIMEYLNDDFVIDMLKDVGETMKGKCYFLGVIYSYLLCCEDEETQHRRFVTVLVPLIDQYLPLQNEQYNKTMPIRNNFQKLFRNLIIQLKEYIVKKKQLVPLKLFLGIQTKLDKMLLKQDNYGILTRWKLNVEFVTLLEQHKSFIFANTQDQIDDSEDIVWNKIVLSILPSFAKSCYEILKEDTRTFLNIIYIFNDIVQEILEDLSCTNRMEFFKYFLNLSSSPEDYVHLIYMCPLNENNKEEENSLEELRELLNRLTPSEVRIHYHHKFDNMY